jgi:hypothetical protein
MTNYFIGDRFQSKWDKRAICTLIKIRNGGKKPYTIEWDNKRKIHCDESWFDEMIFLDDEQCNNLTSAQELGQDSPLRQQSREDSNLLELPKPMNTAQTSSVSASPMSATTAMCELSLLETSETNGEKLTSSQLRRRASRSVSKASARGKQTSATVSPPSKEQLNQSDQNSSVLKMSQDSLTVLSVLDGQHSIFSTSYARLSDSAMMLNGSVLAQECLEAPLLEKDSSWLESPGALSNGNGRPPGQTKQEAQLKKLKVLAPGQVVNPEFLESAYSLPLGWTDPQENKSASELLAKTEQFAIAAQPSEMLLTGELPPLDFAASSILIPYVENQQLQLKAITLHQPWAYLVGRYKWFETRSWSTNYRGKIAIHAAKYQKDTDYWCSLLKDLLPPVEELIFGAVVALADLTDCIFMTEEFINQQSETELRCGLWEVGRYAWKLDENIQILNEPIPAKGKQGLWNIELPFTLVQPVATMSSQSPIDRFLEETKPLAASQKTKQPKGCLYKYLESKKLKDGTTVNYPRIDGERNSENRSHWRWGFNWELRINGKWKGRSIGSIPVEIILDIKLMQIDGASLEEIISFIKLSKTKKYNV